MRRFGLMSVAMIATLSTSSCGPTGPHNTPVNPPVQLQGRPQTRTAPAPSGGDVIQNGGFESGLSPWKLVGSGTGTAKVVTGIAHSGTHSALMGTTAAPAPNGLHGIAQSVTIPANGSLDFWYMGGTNDTKQYASQVTELTDSTGKVIFTCMKTLVKTTTWTEKRCDVSAYAGQTLNVTFGVSDNGYSKTYVYMYVDDVSLAGGGPTPTPSPTPLGTPTPSPTPTRSAHPTPTPTATPKGGSPIQHVIIVLQENRTFENVFHGYPGANTVNSGKDHNGNTVPLVARHFMEPWDPSHHYSDWNTEYRGGKMNGFDLDGIDFGSGAPKDFAYTYAIKSDVQPYWDMAAEGSTTDNMFVDHRSESFSGHMYPIAGASGPISQAQPDYYGSEDPSGGTCDHPGQAAAVNIKTGQENGTFTSCLDFQTMADLIAAKSKSWRYYIDAGSKDTSYVSAYATIRHIRNNAAQWKNVVSPATQVYTDAANGSLANVSWVIGSFANSDHSGQNVPSTNGPNWVASIMNAVGNSKSWGSTAIIFTYDDWGGWFDESVPPQQFNFFDPGFRIPFVVVSPYSKRGYVSHVLHYQGSMLKYIEDNFGLGSLGTADAHSDNLSDMFDYAQQPLKYIPIKQALSNQFFIHQKDYIPPGMDRD